MVLYLLFMIGVIVVLFIIKNKITDIHDKIEDRISSLTKLTERPAETAVALGAAIADKVTRGKRKSRKK